MRETIPTRGRFSASASDGSPYRSSTATFAAAFPDTSAADYGCGMNRPRGAQPRRAGEERAEGSGRGGVLPVGGVRGRGCGAAARGEFQRRADGKRESPRVVGVVDVVDAVQRGAIVEIRTVDENGARAV